MNDINVDQLLSQMRAMAAKSAGQMLDSSNAAGATDFGSLLKQAVEHVNESQNKADSLSKAFESGDANVSVAEVMVALQKAKISFQAMVQVRNKLVSAYQDVMNMQV